MTGEILWAKLGKIRGLILAFDSSDNKILTPEVLGPEGLDFDIKTLKEEQIPELVKNWKILYERIKKCEHRERIYYFLVSMGSFEGGWVGESEEVAKKRWVEIDKVFEKNDVLRKLGKRQRKELLDELKENRLMAVTFSYKQIKCYNIYAFTLARLFWYVENIESQNTQ